MSLSDEDLVASIGTAQGRDVARFLLAVNRMSVVKEFFNRSTAHPFLRDWLRDTYPDLYLKYTAYAAAKRRITE